MNKTTMFLSGLALWGATLATFSTFAFQGKPGVENPNPVNQERHEQVESMFENKDYESFQELFDWRGPARMIDNEDEFNKFVELREARENWNTEKAETLSEELGLWQRDGSGAWKGMRWHGMRWGQGMKLWNGMRQWQGMRWNQGMRKGMWQWNGNNFANCPYQSQ